MTTLEIQITDGDWDAHEADDGTLFNAGGTTLRCEANTAAGSRFNAGLYFPNVTLPADATIDVAYIAVVFPASNRDSPDLTWYGNDVDDANDFATEADVTSRTVTTASVNWSASNVGSGSHVNSPSLVSIVQEIQARAGWVSGQAMCFIAKGDNTAPAEGGSRFTPYETTPANTCILHIEYTAAAAAAVAVAVPQERSETNLMYIEQVKFTEPYGLQLIGGDDQRLSIFLKQRGLPGI